MKTTTKTLTDDQAAKLISKLTAKLGRGGRHDLANTIIASVQPTLGK